jgi:hypothetical protein
MLLFNACSSKSAHPLATTKSDQSINIAQLTYPTQVGDFILQSKKKVGQNADGILLRYLDKRKTYAYLDCLIYPKGDEKDTKKHYQKLLSAYHYMKEKGELKKFNIIAVDSLDLDGTHKAQMNAFEMQNINTAYYSILYLAPIKDHYFRVRLSYPPNKRFLKGDYGKKAVKELFQAIGF